MAPWLNGSMAPWLTANGSVFFYAHLFLLVWKVEFSFKSIPVDFAVRQGASLLPIRPRVDGSTPISGHKKNIVRHHSFQENPSCLDSHVTRFQQWRHPAHSDFWIGKRNNTVEIESRDCQDMRARLLWFSSFFCVVQLIKFGECFSLTMDGLFLPRKEEATWGYSRIEHPAWRGRISCHDRTALFKIEIWFSFVFFIIFILFFYWIKSALTKEDFSA